ncbi:MAG: transcription termination/antitermination protein NusA [Chloroflexi bacterium]|nr:transcription termination/antitermination protein NusA [Chloroflexota bacterium]
MKSEFLIAITQLAAEKNLPKEVVLQAVEAALVSAYKRDAGLVGNIVVRIDREKGSVHAHQQKTVVDEVTDPKIEVTVAEAKAYLTNPALGDVIEFEVTPANAGRIAAQTAKQVVLQRLREAEREMVFEEFSNREGDIVSGVIQRLEPKQAVIDLGKTEAILPASEQVRTEQYRPGTRMKFYLLEVLRSNRGPQLVLSRTHKNLLKRLFELEVPEIYKGVVEIKSIAREAGHRSKVAVSARQEGVDPVGSCVGLRGIRIQNIVNELNGERIDVIQWDGEANRFVANALSPAQVIRVGISEAENTASVIVPDRQLSLAIGKEGQNARLAAKLTGWRIDIKPESAVEAVTAPEPEAAPAKRPAKKRAIEVTEEERPVEPWMEVIEGEEAAAGTAPAGEAPAAPPAGETEPVGVGAGPTKPVIRFAEDVLTPPKTESKKKSKKATRQREETEGKAKKAKKAPRRPVLEDEELEEDLNLGEDPNL